MKKEKIIIYYYNFKNENFCKDEIKSNNFELYKKCTNFTFAKSKANLNVPGWREVTTQEFLKNDIENNINMNDFYKTKFKKLVDKYC